MATTNFNDITKWYLLPLNYVALLINSNTYNFYKNEEKTSLTLDPVLEPNDVGGETIVGYTFIINIAPAANDLGNFVNLLKDIKAVEPTSVTVYLGKNGAGNPAVPITTSQSTLTVKNWSASWNLKADKDTEIGIKLTGVFSVDLVTVTSPIVFVNSNM